MRFRITRRMPRKGETWQVSFTDPSWGESSIYTGPAVVMGKCGFGYKDTKEPCFYLRRLRPGQPFEDIEDSDWAWGGGEWMPLHSFLHEIQKA